jgi:hypothetical protein
MDQSNSDPGCSNVLYLIFSEINGWCLLDRLPIIGTLVHHFHHPLCHDPLEAAASPLEAFLHFSSSPIHNGGSSP